MAMWRGMRNTWRSCHRDYWMLVENTLGCSEPVSCGLCKRAAPSLPSLSQHPIVCERRRAMKVLPKSSISDAHSSSVSSSFPSDAESMDLSPWQRSTDKSMIHRTAMCLSCADSKLAQRVVMPTDQFSHLAGKGLWGSSLAHKGQCSELKISMEQQSCESQAYRLGWQSVWVAFWFSRNTISLPLMELLGGAEILEASRVSGWPVPNPVQK